MGNHVCSNLLPCGAAIAGRCYPPPILLVMGTNNVPASVLSWPYTHVCLAHPGSTC